MNPGNKIANPRFQISDRISTKNGFQDRHGTQLIPRAARGRMSVFHFKSIFLHLPNDFAVLSKSAATVMGIGGVFDKIIRWILGFRDFCFTS